MKDLIEALNRAHELDESSSEWFTKMKNWLKETGAEEEKFFWSDYYDYVDEIYGRAIDKVTEDYEHINVGFEFSTQAGRGMCQVFGNDDDGSGEYTWDFKDDREAVFEFVNESASVDELFNSLVDYLSGKVDCIQWEDNDNYDDEEDFDEALNRAHDLDEDVGDEFYRDAEKELEKHFKCSGAVLEPSIQAGRGSTFLYADDMTFTGSFDFETGEEYINNDDFLGFLRLCLDSFEPVVDSASEDKHTQSHMLDSDTIKKRRSDARKFWYGEAENRSHELDESINADALKKLKDAASSVKCRLTPGFKRYALESPDYIDNVIEDELLYCGRALCKEFPNMRYWKFGENNKLSDRYGNYCVVETGTDEGRILVQLDGDGRIYKLDESLRSQRGKTVDEAVKKDTKNTKIERPKGYKGTAGGYLSIDRYGTFVSRKPDSGGVQISSANYDWIKDNFDLVEQHNLEYKTIWGRGVVYKIVDKKK